MGRYSTRGTYCSTIDEPLSRNRSKIEPTMNAKQTKSCIFPHLFVSWPFAVFFLLFFRYTIQLPPHNMWMNHCIFFHWSTTERRQQSEQFRDHDDVTYHQHPVTSTCAIPVSLLFAFAYIVHHTRPTLAYHGLQRVYTQVYVRFVRGRLCACVYTLIVGAKRVQGVKKLFKVTIKLMCMPGDYTGKSSKVTYIFSQEFAPEVVECGVTDPICKQR